MDIDPDYLKEWTVKNAEKLRGKTPLEILKLWEKRRAVIQRAYEKWLRAGDR